MPLEIAQLSKRYGNKWALRDVDLTADEGHVLGLCGATASGKSTFLNAIAGYGKPYGGSITVDDTEITKFAAKDRGISLFTARETPGLLDVIGINNHKESSGERLLSNFEEMLTNAGKVLLLDDPFAHLDHELRHECFAKVRRAARARERIVIFASSDFTQIAAAADEAAIISDGSIIQTGTPQDLYENPETIAVANITGDCNLFEARRLTSADADLPEFHTIDGGHRVFAQHTEKSRLNPINKNATLAIRPEQITMSMGASFPEDNLLRGVVTGIRFRGSTSLVEFDAAGLKLQTRVFKIVGLNVGDECMLGLPPHRILILKD